MSFENAKLFFAACETGQGWQGCRQYVADGAPFSAQSEPLVDIETVEAYTEWMSGLVNQIMAGTAKYELHTAAYDADQRAATFFATFSGTHTGDGGPVPATGRSTAAEYVYVLNMNADGKIASMTKIWNAPWTMKELGWA